MSLQTNADQFSGRTIVSLSRWRTSQTYIFEPRTF